MPEMDGLTVLKEIRAYDPHAPVIILGGGATEEQENQARGLRVTDFIRKGLSLDVLIECVNRAVQLPAKSVSAQSVAGSATVADTGETILVVDDEPLVRDLLVQFLSLRGYRALGVKDGSAALSMVEQTPPDLILLDLFMPGMGGVEVLKQLRQREYTGGVIVITGSHDEERLDEAWALGPQEVIGKPIDLEQMLISIQLVLVCREC
jgi:CheY-like chemotaxis protein